MILLAALGAIVWAGLKLDRKLFPPDTPPGAYVTVTIPRGVGEDTIAEILHRSGVIASTFSFKKNLVANGDGDGFKPGTYRLRTHEHYAVIVSTLNKGPAVKTVKLVIPEGFAVRDIARKVPGVGITAKSYLEAVAATGPPDGFLAKGESTVGPKGPSLEGFLFPATYQVDRGQAAQRLVDAQLTAFERTFGTLDLTAAKAQKLTKYDVLKIASMVEREAATPEDRPLIAAVIYNRLKAKMPLGIDPTIQYAVGSWRPLTATDLTIDSPYNSRTNTGLLPTPIANPGLASLQAAAKPAKTDYLYFVAIPGDKQRRHFFTASYDAFLKFQQDHPAETAPDAGSTAAGASTG